MRNAYPAMVFLGGVPHGPRAPFDPRNPRKEKPTLRRILFGTTRKERQAQAAQRLMADQQLMTTTYPGVVYDRLGRPFYPWGPPVMRMPVRATRPEETFSQRWERRLLKDDSH